MIEPGSQRERVRREANALIEKIRTAAQAEIRRHRNMCFIHGVDLVQVKLGVYRCPRAGCTTCVQKLGGPP